MRLLEKDNVLRFVVLDQACVTFCRDTIAILASHGGRGDLLLRKVGHTILGDEVVAVDWVESC